MGKEKKPLDPVKQFRDWMKNHLRRMFFSYWERTKALQAARVGRGLYWCAACSAVSKIEGHHIDHIEPVVDPKIGFVDWDVYITRLFCKAANLQLLCKPCHTLKTEKEREVRKAFKTGTYSPDRAAKISKAKQGIPNLNARTPITGIFEGVGVVFGSTKEAAEITAVPRKRVTDILLGRRNHSKGWIFERIQNGGRNEER